MKRLSAFGALLGALFLSACAVLGLNNSPSPAPNVILIIGDGMDDQQITMARNVLTGARGRLRLDDMPQRGTAQVITLRESDPESYNYVADSANAASSIATGELTSTGRIATTAGSDEDLPTLMEMAQAAGLRTGLVVTSSLTDATPATFVSHVSHRRCQGPADMHKRCQADAESPGSIAEQIARSPLDLAIGGGATVFEQATSAGHSVFELAQSQGFEVLRSGEELTHASSSKRLLAVLAPDLLPPALIGSNGGKAASRITAENMEPEPIRCIPNPQRSDVPSLPDMTDIAIQRLSRAPRGFFLMVESSIIDKAAHVRQPCSQIGALGQLDQALSVALKFAHEHGNTLVLITADHAQSPQILLSETQLPGYGPIYSPGYFERVITADGDVMGIGYATTVFERAEMHTGAQVPVFADGPARFSLPTHMEQRALFELMRDFLELE